MENWIHITMNRGEASNNFDLLMNLKNKINQYPSGTSVWRPLHRYLSALHRSETLASPTVSTLDRELSQRLDACLGSRRQADRTSTFTDARDWGLNCRELSGHTQDSQSTSNGKFHDFPWLKRWISTISVCLFFPWLTFKHTSEAKVFLKFIIHNIIPTQWKINITFG